MSNDVERALATVDSWKNVCHETFSHEAENVAKILADEIRRLTTWQSMRTAPKDGTKFLCRILDEDTKERDFLVISWDYSCPWDKEKGWTDGLGFYDPIDWTPISSS